MPATIAVHSRRSRTSFIPYLRFARQRRLDQTARDILFFSNRCAIAVFGSGWLWGCSKGFLRSRRVGNVLPQSSPRSDSGDRARMRFSNRVRESLSPCPRPGDSTRSRVLPPSSSHWADACIRPFFGSAFLQAKAKETASGLRRSLDRRVADPDPLERNQPLRTLAASASTNMRLVRSSACSSSVARTSSSSRRVVGSRSPMNRIISR